MGIELRFEIVLGQYARGEAAVAHTESTQR